MKMVKKILNVVATFRLKQLSSKKMWVRENFNDFFTNSNSILIIPSEDNETVGSMEELIKFLIDHGKDVTIFSTVKQFNNFSFMNYCMLFDYSLDDINKLGLPNNYILKKLRRKHFDIIINLDGKSSIFKSAVIKLCNAHFRIGINNELCNSAYNLKLISENQGLFCPQLINVLNLF